MMVIAPTTKDPVALPLDIILRGFDDFCAAFATITQRAFQRFECRDWRGMRRDAVERLDLYPKIVGTGYFDRLMNAITQGDSLVQALKGSTEESQFKS